ncbi:MAG: hypothetical protein ACREUV_04195 [Burkholderiales bacterium]
MTSYSRHCDQSRGKCPTPHDCATGCHFNEATLHQWDGGAQVEHGFPIEMFELPETNSPALRYLGIAVALVACAAAVAMVFA